MLLFVALLAAGGFVLADSSDEDWEDVAYVELGGDPETEAQTSPEDSSLEDTDPVEVPDHETEGLVRIAADAERERSDLKGSQPTRVVDAQKGFAVRIISADTEAAVAGARLLFYDTLSPNFRYFRRNRGKYGRDKEPVLRRFGEHVRSDELGVAILPHGIPRQTVVARLGSLYGEVRVSGKKPPPPDGFVLRMRRDHTLRVKVVDAAGAPVTGLHLAFYVPFRDRKKVLRWGYWPDRNRDVSSSDGIQELPHIQQVLSTLLDRGEGTLIHFGLDVPGLTKAGSAIDLQNLPEDPIEIVVPKIGQVAVAVRDMDGEPVRRRVRLSTKPDFEYSDLGPAALERFRPKWDLTTDAEGKVLFPLVAASTDLRVQSLGDDVTKSEWVEVTGPVEIDEPLAVELVKEFTAARIEGVAVTSDGQPLRDTRLAYQVGVKAGSKSSAYLNRGSVVTDADGFFRLRLAPTLRVAVPPKKGRNRNRKRNKNKNRNQGKPPAPPKFTEVNAYSSLRLSIATGDKLTARGRVTIPRVLAVQRYDVGRVKLELPALIASGRVFLDDRLVRFFDRFVVDAQNPKNKNRWQKVNDLRAYGRQGGRFEIRGEQKGRVLRLRARSWGYLPVAPIAIAFGQKDIEVRLYSAGALRLALLYDIEAADAQLEVMLRPEEIENSTADGGLKWRFVGRVDKQMSGNLLFRKVYWWTGLPRGNYRMELRMLGATEPFMVLRDLTPHFGGNPRFVPAETMNLRGAVTRAHVRAVDAKGRPIAGRVVPLHQTAAGAVESLPMSRRGAVVHTTARSADVQILAKGYRTETVYGLTANSTVRMRPGIPITVTIVPRMPRGVRIQAKMRRVRYRPQQRYADRLRNPVNGRGGSRFLADLMGERQIQLRPRRRRQWKATVMEHGQFRLDLTLVRKGKKPLPLKGGYGPRLMMVRDTATEHKFSVRLRQPMLDQALQKLGVKIKPKKPGRQRGKQKRAQQKKRK